MTSKNQFNELLSSFKVAKIDKRIRFIRNYSAKEPICRNGSPLSDESKDGIKRGLSVFPCRVGNGMESVEGIGAGIGTEAT